eukprot:3831360-Alexandrium_andersonii.AAC.1
MSASLVGSEMCIRDSMGSARRRRTPVCASVARTSPQSRRWLPADAAAPVSYTHLTLPTICSV